MTSSAGTRLVFARELQAWFDGAIATVAIVAALLAVLSSFMNEFFVRARLDMAPFFELLPIVLVLFVPALAMRSWAEDRKLRTFELWMTLPLTPLQIVLGKYAAALAVYAVFLLGTLPVPILLFSLGSPDPGPIVGGYLGAALLGALFLAIGQYLSGLTADQVVAFLATALACAFLVATGEPRVVAALDGLSPSLAAGTLLSEWVSALPRFEAFARGSVSLGGIAYFAGLAAIALGANAASVTRNRT
ncbi:MAG: ABC-2 transporter permease [Planctomycetota bacterium]